MKPEFFHQSMLAPEDNKFHKGNGDDGKHYWLTPPELLAQLSAEFGPFDFDPCPFPKPDDFDGLTCEWGRRNYVNPPFGSILHMGKKKGPTAWVRKSIEEWAKGKLVVLVYPVDKWILMILKAILGPHAEVRNLGDVKWLATEDGSVGKGTGRHIACFILRPRPCTGNKADCQNPMCDAQNCSSAAGVRGLDGQALSGETLMDSVSRIPASSALDSGASGESTSGQVHSGDAPASAPLAGGSAK